MAEKILLTDVKSGMLVGQVRAETVEFVHNCKEYEVDIAIKQLPFGVTDGLHKRMNKGEDVAAEWIALALVDENGKQSFTKAQVENNFVQPMANAIFDKVWGLDNAKKAIAQAKTKAKKKE